MGNSVKTQRANPSVKGTSCAKAQAAPYVERWALEMLSDLEPSLRQASLLTSAAAADALEKGWQIVAMGPPSVADEMAIVTYSLRAQHVRAKPGEHWQQLAASTDEFVQNLRSIVGALVECLAISGDEEHRFIVFRCIEPPRILGCMRVLPGSLDAFNSANEPAA